MKLSASAPARPASATGLRNDSDRRREEAQQREADRDRISALRNGLAARGLADVVSEIARANFVTVADILGGSRDKSVSRARHAVCVALYQPPYSKSTTEIAKLLGTDSSGVAQAIRKARAA